MIDSDNSGVSIPFKAECIHPIYSKECRGCTVGGCTVGACTVASRVTS